MALLTLKDIGKIYVSETNVSVGIRGVNLSFDRGEFVAVTGKSGSGKSTLLNVISGMDTYEEGELYIEGEATSHYLQPEWEAYREKYISFVFQDYNIIDSFTVLQNVELALMHIEDKRERRRRATELIKRVGLGSQMRQKGSRLSGGQKQRTVIARALAKDSPIILADEPTGNLDSNTSREIVKLLHEVAVDKLLIVVTHNYEQFEEYATRHIRIFDGAVESDHELVPTAEPIAAPKKEEAPARKPETPKKAAKRRKKKQRRNGVTLGKSIFTAKPKLSTFLCLLLIIGTLGVFMVTSMCGDAFSFLKPFYMFEHIDGRVVVTTQDGSVMSEDAVAAMADKYGADSYMHFDLLLDAKGKMQVTLPAGEAADSAKMLDVTFTYGKTYGDGVIGRYPEAADEVLLYLPLYLADRVGTSSLKLENVYISEHMSLKLVGVKYYYDNNLAPECLFTEDGFRTATAMYTLLSVRGSSFYLNVTADKNERRVEIQSLIPSFDMPEGKIYISSQEYSSIIRSLGEQKVKTEVCVSSSYKTYHDGYTLSASFARSFGEEYLTDEKPQYIDYIEYDASRGIIVSDELICEIAEEVLGASYRQASFFFENDAAAYAAAERMRADGYLAVPSDTTYEPDALTAILNIIGSVMSIILWALAIIFLAFFINICTSRTLNAFKGDMAIMRSMGIQVKVIRIAMYVRMLIALIPAMVLLLASALLIYTTPRFNGYFTYLYAWQYAVIVLGMLFITVRVTRKQMRKLFGESVKKALKGGSAE